MPDFFKNFFDRKRWEPTALQRRSYQALGKNRYNLIAAPTGEGKTLAAFLPLLEQAIKTNTTLLWITPLKALAFDTAKSLENIIGTLDLADKVMYRTGDTSASDKKLMFQKPPRVLVTTPESLHLLLSQKTAYKLLNQIESVVVDEWHSLLANKRGVQTSLGISALTTSFNLKDICGISATISDPDLAAKALFNTDTHYKLIQPPKKSRIKEKITLLQPDTPAAYSWRGHIGLKMVPRVYKLVSQATSSIIFVNTRAGAEFWFEALQEKVKLDKKQILTPADVLIHHGSLEIDHRRSVEEKLKNGTARVVIATASLDLGLDFQSVELVVQVSSPKSITRLRQRAGRSNHRPGVAPEVFVVPTFTLEILEIQAIKNLLQKGRLDPVAQLPENALDVAAQYVSTRVCGSAVDKSVLKKELQNCYYYHDLDKSFWQQVLAIVTQGGKTLGRYEQFQHVVQSGTKLEIASKRHAMRHRFNIGTIEGGQPYQIINRRRRIGTIDDAFAAKLKPGDKFQLGGKFYQVQRMHNTDITVKRTRSGDGFIPRWTGSRLPIADHLADELRRVVSNQNDKAGYLINIQNQRSRVPNQNQLLIEHFKTREGHHIVIYPFAGQVINEQIATLIAHRWLKNRTDTISFTANDYGFELLSKSAELVNLPAELNELLTIQNVMTDLVDSQNFSELAKRRFATIARIGGLLFPGFPWQAKRYSHLAGSSDTLYEALVQFEPNHPLIQQARIEVLTYDLQIDQVKNELDRLGRLDPIITNPNRLTPFAFPVVAERLKARLTSESFKERIKKYQLQLETKTD
jgi:ATP-dependent Lhr-like helicase